MNLSYKTPFLRTSCRLALATLISLVVAAALATSTSHRPRLPPAPFVIPVHEINFRSVAWQLKNPQTGFRDFSPTAVGQLHLGYSLGRDYEGYNGTFANYCADKAKIIA